MKSAQCRPASRFGTPTKNRVQSVSQDAAVSAVGMWASTWSRIVSAFSKRVTPLFQIRASGPSRAVRLPVSSGMRGRVATISVICRITSGGGGSGRRLPSMKLPS
jgi:hypothetical protein